MSSSPRPYFTSYIARERASKGGSSSLKLSSAFDRLVVLSRSDTMISKLVRSIFVAEEQEFILSPWLDRIHSQHWVVD